MPRELTDSEATELMGFRHRIDKGHHLSHVEAERMHYLESQDERIDSEAWARRALSDDALPKTPTKTPRDELADWWADQATEEIDMVVDKAIEYSSTDLEDIGHQVNRMAGRPPISDAEAAQLGIYFYIEGKLARWRGAIMQGRVASADTLKDIGVYVRMAQRVQQTGGWPGTKEQLA